MSALHNQVEYCTKLQAILGLGLALALGGFYLFGYRPNSTRLSDLQMQIDGKRRDLTANMERVKILPDVQRVVEDLQFRVDKFDKQLPRQQELDRFIKDINTMVHTASLRRVVVEPTLVPIRGEMFAELPISLRFEGDFLNVFSFLRQTEEMQRLTRIKELKLRSTGDRPGKPGQVEVELSMNIYFSEG